MFLQENQPINKRIPDFNLTRLEKLWNYHRRERLSVYLGKVWLLLAIPLLYWGYTQGGSRAAKTNDTDSSGRPEEHKTPGWNRRIVTFSIISNSWALAGRKCSVNRYSWNSFSFNFRECYSDMN